MPLEIGRLRGSTNAAGNDHSHQYLRLPAAENSSLEVISDLCTLASDSQTFYRSVSTKQWLRTVVSLDGLSIHSNVVPRDAYLLLGNCLDPGRCRGFSPVIENPNRSCRTCALKQQMVVESDTVDGDQSKHWLQIEDQVHIMKDLFRGVVHKIAWRRGTFVRKRFNCKGLFERELAVATRVSHPNLVHCFGFSLLESGSSDLEPGSGFASQPRPLLRLLAARTWFWNQNQTSDKSSDLFMECLDNDLQTLLQEATPFTFHDRLNVLLQVAEGMKHLHESGYVHGDLKPQNVFLSRVELAHTGVQCYLVKVGDFGTAQVADASFRAYIGTTHYTAPEVFRYKGEPLPQDHDPKMIDVFSFGVVAFQVLTGAVNLYVGYRRGSDVAEAVMNGIRPRGLEDQGANLDGTCSSSMLTLVERCWAENPNKRPSFSEIRDVLNSSYNELISNEHGLCVNLALTSEAGQSGPQRRDELNEHEALALTSEAGHSDPQRRDELNEHEALALTSEEGHSGPQLRDELKEHEAVAKRKRRWHWWRSLKQSLLFVKLDKPPLSPYDHNGSTQI